MKRWRVTQVLLVLASEEAAEQIDELEDLDADAEVQAEADRAVAGASGSAPTDGGENGR
jgi:hypothetical protein